MFNLLHGAGINSAVVFWFLVVIMRTDVFVLDLRFLHLDNEEFRLLKCKAL
jgi:hypothetical protein